jgi:hypothetical protein
VVWLLPILCPAATLKDRFAQGRNWLRRLAPRLRLAGTYQGFVKALRRRGEMLTFWLRAAVQGRVSLVPKLLFGNGRFSKLRFAPANSRETEFRKTCVPKQEFENEGNHSPLTTHHSPLTTRHSPLTTRHSPLSI